MTAERALAVAPEPSLRPLLEARSVAVVGASRRPGSFGERLMLELLQGGFEGRIHPVNPRYREIEGLRCVPALEELADTVDLVLLGVPNPLLEQQMRAAAAVGIRAAVVFASCYEPVTPPNPPLPERLGAIARAAGMPVCGGNCMGFLNLDANLRACGYAMPKDMPPGPITFLSHSGSAFAALAYNDRRLRFNVIVSTGQELATPAAEYLHHALDLPTTRVVALFLETVRHAARFRAALERAAAQDIPVVALKVGRTTRAKELAAAHSGALAGEDGAYEALFDAYGVARVRSLDEMADTLELFVSRRPARPGGLAAVNDSGGERVMLIDAAADAGVPFARISETTRARLEEVLEEGLPPVNPLDAWGTGNDYEAIFVACMRALLDDPDTAALALCVDLTTEMYAEGGYVLVAKRIFESTDAPVAVMSNLASAIDRRDVESLRGAGVPVLEGTMTGLAAFRHLLARRDFRARPAVVHPPRAASVAPRWRARLRSGAPLSEVEGLRLLADYGVPTVRAALASSLEGALGAADEVGWPVALKTAAPDVGHKTDIGGVALGLAGAEALGAAYADIAARLGPRVTVASMASPGVELALGVIRDSQFGPLIMAAAGGVLIELLRDRSFALPPVDAARARELVNRLRVRPLLDGVRGTPGADLDAVAAAVGSLSALAEDLGDHIEALDVNPLVAAAHGCVAADVLVVPRA